MTASQLFINEAGRLRSGWRLLVFVLVYIALLLIATSVVRVIYLLVSVLAPNAAIGDYVQNLVFRILLLITALVAAYVCTRWLEGLPWQAIGLGGHARWFLNLLVGSAIGIGTMVVAAAIAIVGGGLTFSISPLNILPQVGKTLLFSGVLFFVAALAEEALFRGYPLQTLSRAKLAWLGVLLTSVPFAAVHLDNPNAGQALASINTALAGVWLAVSYLRTRSLWLPLGVHWAWNWALGALFGLPVSGITTLAPNPLMRGIDIGPSWLTGGRYGIEGGLACTIALVVSTLFIWRTRLVTATEEMKRLTSVENPTRESEQQGRM